MPAAIIDGKAAAADVRRRVAAEVEHFGRQHGLVPGLAVVLVGADAASEIYVRHKAKETVAAGMRSFVHRLASDVAEADLLALIAGLTADAGVHGILVQLPLPKHIDAAQVTEAIDPAKDVDGFHPINVGRLATGEPALVPCTPQGVMLLLQGLRADMSGLQATVIGRSNIVGKPLVQLLLAANATVTVAHSRTHDLAGVARRADILVAAVGRPELVRGDWIKPGAIVIDVGINRVPADGTTRLVGDVAFNEAQAVASAITPVPGGVGPMTIACLLSNTLEAARLRIPAAPR
jgi:methylenetetrahydrofolate dehydrogenase (NADP+) / methenyltetrahydrofolate cyclohydrolase